MQEQSELVSSGPTPLLKQASPSIDDTDKMLLSELIKNGRTSASMLSSVVGLTRQATTARIDRLASDGVIKSYTIKIDPDSINLAVRAFISIALQPQSGKEGEQKVVDYLRSNPWVQDCYRVTGQAYFQIRIVAPDLSAIRELLMDLREVGYTQNTSSVIALETMFEKSSIGAYDNSSHSKFAEPIDPLLPIVAVSELDS